MAEEKTYVFGEGAGNNGILSLLGPMLSQRGVDPNVLLAMQGRNNDGFGEGGWFIWVIHCSYWIDNICWRISKYIWSWKRSFSNAY